MFASISLHRLVGGCWEHLHFSEETSLEPDFRLLPTEANHSDFISAALQIAFQVVRTVKAPFSSGRGTLSPRRGHLHFITQRGSPCQVLTQLLEAGTHSRNLASQREAASKFPLGLQLESGSTTQSEDGVVSFLSDTFCQRWL